VSAARKWQEQEHRLRLEQEQWLRLEQEQRQRQVQVQWRQGWWQELLEPWRARWIAMAW
jgi:hypothetical protein